MRDLVAYCRLTFSASIFLSLTFFFCTMSSQGNAYDRTQLLLSFYNIVGISLSTELHKTLDRKAVIFPKQRRGKKNHYRKVFLKSDLSVELIKKLSLLFLRCCKVVHFRSWKEKTSAKDSMRKIFLLFKGGKIARKCIYITSQSYVK